MSLKRWEQKELIQSLRQGGLSYREILSQVPFSLSRSTISSWCKDIELTPEQLDRLDQLYREGSYRGRLLGPKATQRRRQEEVEVIRARARSEVAQLKSNQLWLAGLMLYWAEGDKKRKVGFSNSDPHMVRFIMKWFREICGVSENKFRAHLNIHFGQDDNALKGFWSEITGLPVFQFGKSYVKAEGTGQRKNVLYRGTIKLSICDRNVLHGIHGWIQGYYEQNFGPLAQSVEHLTLNQGVDGSIPSRPI